MGVSLNCGDTITYHCWGGDILLIADGPYQNTKHESISMNYARNVELHHVVDVDSCLAFVAKYGN